jgi:hypothetical protein
MSTLRKTKFRYKPCYIARDEASKPLFCIEFTESTYSLVNDSFFDERTILKIHKALDYSQSAVIEDTPFDYKVFSELIQQDIFWYLNCLPQNQRDDIPSQYITDGKLHFEQLKFDKFLYRDFLFTGEIKNAKHRIRLERIFNAYLQQLGYNRFVQAICKNCYAMSPDHFIQNWFYRLDPMLQSKLRTIGECKYFQMNRSRLYVFKAGRQMQCFIQTTYA